MRFRLVQSNSGDWYIVDAEYTDFVNDEFEENVDESRYVIYVGNNPSSVLIKDFDIE